jgi:MFS family permease
MNGFSFSVLLPAMNAELGWSRSTIVFGSGISGVVAALAGPPLGRLMDKRGAKPVIIFSILGLGLSLIMSGLVFEPWQFYLAYGLACGVCRSALGSVAPGVLITHWFLRRRATAFGIAAVGPPCVNLLLPPILAVVVAVWGWRAGWITLGIVPLIVALAPTLLFVRKPTEADAAVEAIDARVIENAPRRRTHVTAEDWSAAEVMHSPAFWGLAIAMAFVILGPNVTGVFMYSYLNDRGLDTTAAAATISSLSALQVASRIVLWTPGVQRLGVRWTLIVWGAALASVCIGLAVAPTPEWAFAAAAALGLAMGGNLVLQLQIWPEYFGRASVGVVIGTGQMVQGLSSAIGPLCLAALIDHGGTYSQLFWIVSGITILGLLMHLKIGRPVRPITGTIARKLTS